MSIEPDRFFSPAKDTNDARFDHALRPQELSEYIGQQGVKEQMQIFIEAARQRGALTRERAARRSSRPPPSGRRPSRRQTKLRRARSGLQQR